MMARSGSACRWWIAPNLAETAAKPRREPGANKLILSTVKYFIYLLFLQFYLSNSSATT